MFDIKMKNMEYEFSVTNWRFSPQTKQDLQASFLTLVKPFVPKIVSYRKIWKKPIYQFSMGIGYIQLVKRLVLIKDGEVLYSGEKFTDFESASVELMILLSHLFEGDECTDRLKKELPEYVKGKGTNSTTWDNFFTLKGGLSKFDINPEGIMIRLIKATMKECLGPATQEFKTTFSERFPFKSIKDSWKTNITISDKVEIYHQQTEQSKGENIDGFFTFDWQVIF